jgi:hypothetical protein
MQTNENLCLGMTGDAARAALEIISPLLIWVNRAGTPRQRGLRASVILYCFGPHLIDAATLEEIGTQAGCSRQAVHKVVNNLRALMKTMAQTPPQLFSLPLDAA